MIIIRCFCINPDCNRILITKEKINFLNLDSKLNNKARFNKLAKVLEKIPLCCRCNRIQPKISLIHTEGIITRTIKSGGGGEKITVQMTVREIKKMFESLEDEDLYLLGLDPKLMHPRNLIMTVLPVLPPVSRPFVVSEGRVCDDDLSIQILEIIKNNNHLSGKEITEIKRQKYMQSLKFRISTLFNNSQGRAKHTTNGRPIKGIKERLTGKGGLIRNHMMGKRVEFSGRTVITPGPNLKLGEIAIPEEIARNLTYPERVTSFNIKKLTDIVNNGRANFVDRKIPNSEEISHINLAYALWQKGTQLLFGDIIQRDKLEIKVENNNVKLEDGDILIRDGNIFKNIKYPRNRYFKLRIGDLVERHLMNGDIVLLNRQPTLWKGSMMAMNVVIHKNKTFSFNLSATSSFNADFK